MSERSPGGLLHTIVAMLDAAEIPYMVVGSFASTAHGSAHALHGDLDLRRDRSNLVLAERAWQWSRLWTKLHI